MRVVAAEVVEAAEVEAAAAEVTPNLQELPFDICGTREGAPSRSAPFASYAAPAF
jgi:hypothetical protein